MYKRLSLTTSMLLLTVCVGLVIWVISDTYQLYALNSVFRNDLNQRFSEQAREQRLRFDNYVKSFNPSVKLYAASTNLKSYIDNVSWTDSQKVITHKTVPAWLPKLSSMRRFVHPRFAMLLDESGTTKELYQYKSTPPPEKLMKISALKLELSKGQGYLTLFDNRAYLLASEDIQGRNKKATLLIASPIDEKFLRDSQGVSTDKSIIALLKEGEKKIMVSSNEPRVPAGTALTILQQSYLIAGEGFFDSGSADIIVRVYSLTSTQEVEQKINKLLQKDRKIRVITAFIFITSFALVMYWITSRIQKLSRRVVEFSDDMNIAQPDLRHNDELMVLENRFELLAEAVQSETQSLEYQALHDPLTNIPNRKFFNDRLQQEISSCELSGSNFVLMICDLNRFKEVNDNLGHHIGDLVLQQASERLKSALRKDDTVARLGGDEFCILLKKTNIIEAEKIAEKISAAFNKAFDIEDHCLSVGISIGVAVYPKHGNSKSILMRHADTAMYAAKEKRCGYSIYKSEER